jgi:hypothetical protein
MKTTNAIIFSVAIVLAAIFLGNAYVERSNKSGTVNVTGLASKDFVSDIVVWEGDFARLNKDLKQAYAALEQDKEMIKSYLNSKGVSEHDIVFKAVETSEKNEAQYQNGDYIGEEFIGYQLRQSIEIESNDVEGIEELSRSITVLLNQGVKFYSNPPRYYYTKLADLKIEMIQKAAENARIRAKAIASNSGGALGGLRSANMGVFQITGQNSNEDYSWGGAFNTKDKNKTASITMRLVYEVEG